jgi:hypothetical protein
LFPAAHETSLTTGLVEVKVLSRDLNFEAEQASLDQSDERQQHST